MMPDGLHVASIVAQSCLLQDAVVAALHEVAVAGGGAAAGAGAEAAVGVAVVGDAHLADDAQSKLWTPLLPPEPAGALHCCQTLPMQLVATPLQLAGVWPPARHFLAAAQSVPAAAMQLTSAALRCAAAASDGSLTSATICVQALMPPTMMPQAAGRDAGRGARLLGDRELPQPRRRSTSNES